MALSKTILARPQGFPDGVQVTDAYHRVDQVSGGKIRMDFILGVYQSASTLTPIESRSYSFQVLPDGDSFIKQAYEFLKTLPEFANAVDC